MTLNHNSTGWLCSFFQKLDCFSPNKQKNQLPLVDFISVATVFVYLQYPLKTWSWVSCSCFKGKKKWKLFWCKNKKKRGVRGKRGAHREPGLTVTKTFKGSSPLFNTLAFWAFAPIDKRCSISGAEKVNLVKEVMIHQFTIFLRMMPWLYKENHQQVMQIDSEAASFNLLCFSGSHI